MVRNPHAPPAASSRPRLLLALLLLAVGLAQVPGALARPALDYATFLGGDSDDWVLDVAADAAGSLYLTGYTYSADFPGAAGSPRGADMFITKLDPSGRRVIYTARVGGGEQDRGLAITPDGSGGAWVVGATSSTDFPLVDPVLVTQVPDSLDERPVAAHVDASGRVDFSSYVGLRGQARAVALDGAGRALIGGNMGRAVVVVLDAATHDYRTDIAFTGIYPPTVNALAVDAQGNIYLAGTTDSDQLPLANPVQATCGRYRPDECSYDAFVVKVTPAGDEVLFGTYLGGSAANGGSGRDVANALTLGPDGSIYVAGETYSGDFPTARAFQSTKPGENNLSEGFLARLAPQGDRYTLAYSTYLAGSESESVSSLAVDGQGNAFVGGYTGSPDFPAVAALQGELNRGRALCNFGTEERLCYDGFLTQVAPDGRVPFSSLLGGRFDDAAEGLAVTPVGVVLAGVTGSLSFPTTPNALQPAKGKLDDGFLVRLGAGDEAPAYRVLLPLVRR